MKPSKEIAEQPEFHSMSSYAVARKAYITLKCKLWVAYMEIIDRI